MERALRARSEKTELIRPNSAMTTTRPRFEHERGGIEAGEPRAAEPRVAGEAVQRGEALQGQSEAGGGGDDSGGCAERAAPKRQAGGEQEDRRDDARQGQGLGKRRPGPAQAPGNLDGARREPEIDREQQGLRGGDAGGRAQDQHPLDRVRIEVGRNWSQAFDEGVEFAC